MKVFKDKEFLQKFFKVSFPVMLHAFVLFIVSFVVSIIYFLVMLILSIVRSIKKVKFNIKNFDNCALRLDVDNRDLIIAKTNDKIAIENVIDVKYHRMSRDRFFLGFFNIYYEKKKVKKENIGKLDLYLIDGNKITLERIADVQKVHKSLKELLDNK